MFTLFLLIAAIELFVQGPVIVGIPVLANTRLPQGALAVGIISSAYAVGALLGAVSAGALPTPKRRLGHILVIAYVLSGILIMPFGFLTATWLAAGLVVAIGVMGGYTNIMFTTWLQARTPQKVMGRVMSLLMNRLNRPVPNFKRRLRRANQAKSRLGLCRRRCNDGSTCHSRRSCDGK